MNLRNWLEEYRLKRKIGNLSVDERRKILSESPFEVGAFQGEGFHVFLKDEPDFEKGYVASLGEISGEAAENWIIRRFMQQKQKN